MIDRFTDPFNIFLTNLGCDEIVYDFFAHHFYQMKVDSHRYFQQIVAPGWGKINQAASTGERKEKINMRLQSVRFPPPRQATSAL